MKVLIAYGSKRGGTEGIARLVGEALGAAGLGVQVASAREVESLEGYDAVIVGGALYANRWQRDARRMVKRLTEGLRERPVWFFSSGPLDESADVHDIPPTKQVARLMERVGARGHVTFGGRLTPDAQGFPASALAKTHSGDWRDAAHIRTWALSVAQALTSAAGARPAAPAQPEQPHV